MSFGLFASGKLRLKCSVSDDCKLGDGHEGDCVPVPSESAPQNAVLTETSEQTAVPAAPDTLQTDTADR